MTYKCIHWDYLGTNCYCLDENAVNNLLISHHISMCHKMVLCFKNLFLDMLKNKYKVLNVCC